jgi:hypothetical protein
MNALREITEQRNKLIQAERKKLWRPSKQASREIFRLQCSLRERFAELNGWKVSKTRFPLSVLRDNKPHGRGDPWHPRLCTTSSIIPSTFDTGRNHIGRPRLSLTFTCATPRL